MPQTTQAAFEAPVQLDDEQPVDARRPSAAARSDVRLSIHKDMASIEPEWRAFEAAADGTVFQSFDWLSTWQRCIGTIEGATPAVVTGHDSRGQMLFLLPLAVEKLSFTRRLTWLGTALCDYNGPLLAPDFFERFDVSAFKAVWRDVLARLRDHPALWFDVVAFDKMQRTVGPQANPFMALGVRRMPTAPTARH